jgi:chromosome segregation ATPase
MKKAEENHRSAMEAAIITSNNDVDKKTKELQLKVTSLQSEREKIEADCSRQLEIMQDKLDKDEKRHKINIKNIHSDYERDVEDKTKRMIKLEEKLNELTRKYKKDLGESNTRLIEFEVKYNDAKRDSESSAQRIEPMEEQISKQIREIARLKDMASASGGTIGELEGKLEVSKQQLASISTKYETQRREADRSRNSLRESQAQVSELRTEVSALKSQVQEIPVHEAEVDRLRRKIEEGSSHQNAVIRELQARAHEAENRAQRAEEKIVEETTKIKMECSRLKQELANNEKQVEAIQSDVESRLRDQDEMHSRSLDDLSAKNRRLQSEKESISRTMEQMRSDHHTQIMELQDRLTTEAEQYFLQGKEQADTEINSLKRKLEKNQREAEEQAYRQEQSWLTERSYMRKELDTARGAAQHAQKALQKLMLDMERQVISTDKIKGELRASKQALADTNASLLEMRKISTVAEAEKIKVQRLEGELRASESVNAHAQHLEQQLRDTERALQEAVAQKLEVETQLGSLVNSSRVDQLREKVGRLRDAVSGDKSDNGTNFSYNNDNGLTNHSERGILDALSIDHSRALSANGELRRELSREQDAAAAANKRLYEEREAASSKIKQLTTILRQAQESWDREREDILDSRRKAEVAKHEFESAAKLYSRLSKDATQERDNALRSFEEQSQVLQKKRAELQEARSTILNLRDENINLSHQSDLLRTEVSKITNVTTRKRKIKYDLQNELSMASGELGSTGIDSLGIRNNGIRNKTTNYEKGFLGVREADEEVNAMRNFFGVERSSRLKDESEKVAWDVRKRSVGEV